MKPGDVKLGLGADEVLTTTRAVRRRLDFDRAVPESLVRECVEIAVQAPSGSNARGWHFVVVGDEAKRRRIGELYHQAFQGYRDMPVSARNNWPSNVTSSSWSVNPNRVPSRRVRRQQRQTRVSPLAR